MLSYTTKERLASLFELLSENEQKIEAIRQVLAEITTFNPLTVFNRLDLSCNGTISTNEIVNFLYQNNVAITRLESQFIFNQFNIDSDHFVYNRFLQIILPKKNSYLKSSIITRCQTAKLKNSQILPYEQEWALTRFFQQALKSYQSVKTQKDYLFQSLDFSIRDAFQAIDTQDKGYITLQNLEYFLAENRHPLKFDSLTTLFELLDQDGDSRISINEFAFLIDKNNFSFKRNDRSNDLFDVIIINSYYVFQKKFSKQQYV